MAEQYLHDVSFSVINSRCSIIGIATDEAERLGLEGTELVEQICSASFKEGFLLVETPNLGQFRIFSLKQQQSMARIQGLAYVLAAALLKSENQ